MCVDEMKKINSFVLFYFFFCCLHSFAHLCFVLTHSLLLLSSQFFVVVVIVVIDLDYFSFLHAITFTYYKLRLCVICVHLQWYVLKANDNRKNRKKREQNATQCSGIKRDKKIKCEQKKESHQQQQLFRSFLRLLIFVWKNSFVPHASRQGYKV